MFSRQVLRAARVAAPQRLIATAPVRTFAAAAATEIKAPIQVFGIDGTYATALVRPFAPPTRQLHFSASCLVLQHIASRQCLRNTQLVALNRQNQESKSGVKKLMMANMLPQLF